MQMITIGTGMRAARQISEIVQQNNTELPSDPNFNVKTKQ